MKITLADKFIAWLTLISGLSISAVAVYYSVAGLISIFAAAVIPIAIMGIVLELSKLVATVWLKQNWFIAPRFIKAYLLIAVSILMVITSMGIFGYLSKAHMDQTLVSGDVQSKIAIYDEKIKTARENIEANRKQLKQMDEAVDQVMARSTTEEGATKANNIRRAQQRDRTQLARDIEANQKLIASLNDESAPIRAEVRKVEAEVGPIKYIAALIYGDDPDTNLLERAVRWVIIVIVIVFDPLAVILLLASQYSFQWFRKVHEEDEFTPDPYVADVGEKPTEEEKADFLPTYEEITPKDEEPRPHHPDTHPYLREGFKYPEGWGTVPPQVGKPAEGDSPQVEASIANQTTVTELSNEEIDAQLDKDLLKPTVNINDLPASENAVIGQRHRIIKNGVSTYFEFDGSQWVEQETVEEKVFEQEQPAIEQWNKMISEAERAIEEESKKKSTYMIKNQDQQIVKTKE